MYIHEKTGNYSCIIFVINILFKICGLIFYLSQFGAGKIEFGA